MKTFPSKMADKARKKTVHSYWQHKQPQYDGRTSCFINTGTEYGVGHTNPVGHHGEPKKEVATLPQHVKTFNPKANYNVIEAEG